MQHFQAADHQNNSAKSAGRGRGSVLQQGGWSSTGAALEMEKTGWKGAWHVVQGTAMAQGGRNEWQKLHHLWASGWEVSGHCVVMLPV